MPGDFETIQAAIDAAATGDKIEVEARSNPYEENLDVETDGLKLIGVSGRPVIDGFDPDSTPVTLDIEANNFSAKKLALRNEEPVNCIGDGCSLRDLTFRGKLESDCIEVDGDDALVADNRFEACGDNAVDVTGANGRVLRNNAQGIDSDCYNLTGPGHLFRDNFANRCEDGEGLELDNGDDGVVEDNTVESTDNGGIDAAGDGLTVRGNLVERMDDECYEINGADVRFEDNVGINCDNGADIGNDNGADGAIVTGNRIRRAQDSECIDVDGNGVLVADNRVDECFKGIDARGENPVVADNRIVDITADDGIGFSCEDDPDPPDPVPEAEACKDAEVSGNLVDGTGDDDSGISISIASDPGPKGSALISGNTVRDAFDDGIEIFADNAVIERNTVTRAGAEEEDGIEVFGSGNVIQKNVSTRNGGDGIRVSAGGDPGNVIRNNTVRDNNQDGIRTDGNADLVAGNLAESNLGEGIEVDGLVVDVRDNVSRGNAQVDCASDGTINENSGNDCGDDSNFLIGSSGLGG